MFNCHSLDNDALDELVTNCTNLKNITLSQCNNVTDDGIIMLTVRLKSTLEKLIGFWLPLVTDKGLMFIANNCPNLIKLDFSSNREISDNGVINLAEDCKKLKNLRTSHVKHLDKLFNIIFVNANCIKALEEEVVIS